MPFPVTSPPTVHENLRKRAGVREEDDPRRGVTKATVAVSDQVRPPGTILGGNNGQEGEKIDAGANNAPNGSRALWWTTEFKLYYLIYLVGVPLLWWVPIRLSKSEWTC
jgi:hypothetical protein